MVDRSTGLTNSERVLARLGRRSFLSLWSHANVYRAPGKEICDLLVIFDEHVVIFSDKTCAFPDKPLDVAWSRWRRNTVDESIEQLFGAERWIRKHPDRVFLDVGCTTPFPFPIPANARVHLVCIANGATERCRKELGGSGSLVQVPDADSAKSPFIVNVVRAGRVIHLLDDFTCPLVFGELDTAPDFLAYLTAKEDLFLAGQLSCSCGEESTLAAFLCCQPNLVPLGTVDVDQTIVFSEMLWPNVLAEPGYSHLREIRKASAFFDEWLDETADMALSGEMYSGGEHGVMGHEERLRVLARTSRSERHALTMAGLSIFGGPFPESSEPEYLLRCVRLASQPETIYAFAVVPEAPEVFTPEEYRVKRQEILRDYCMAIKGAHPEVRHVAGLASAPVRPGRPHSEDVCYIGGPDWTHELQKLACEVRRVSGLYSQRRVIEIAGDQYSTPYSPPRPESAVKRRKRNERKRRRKQHRH
jgi:hypothetical protein